MSFDPNLLHNNGHNGYPNGTSVALRETGAIEKLTSYGFIQCSEWQAGLFFHCSQYNGNLQDLKVGDDVEFEVSSDRRTGKPIAIKLVKIKPEIHPEERMNGQVSDFDTLYFLRAPYLNIFHIRRGRLSPASSVCTKRALVYKDNF